MDNDLAQFIEPRHDRRLEDHGKRARLGIRDEYDGLSFGDHAFSGKRQSTQSPV
jgi:hypothetical protein